ncbi:MAG: DUF5615 family PIN-like protein [Dehalococcoidia bacterium]
MSTIDYLLDENVDLRLHETLQQRWPQIAVRRVGGKHAPPLGTPDPEIVRWCEANGRSLVTNNRRSMPLHLRAHLAAGGHVPGIFLLPHQSSLGDIAERLAIIWGASRAEEYRDQIVYLTQVT